jgi:hypothetical protein
VVDEDEIALFRDFYHFEPTDAQLRKLVGGHQGCDSRDEALRLASDLVVLRVIDLD